MKKTLILISLLFPFSLCLVGCKESEPMWKNDALFIQINYENSQENYSISDYFSFEYLERSFRGLDIRYKINVDDNFIVKTYRNITYIITLK